MLTKDYINDEIDKIRSQDELCERSLSVLADLLFVKKNFHMLKSNEKLSDEKAEWWVAHMENSDGTKGCHWNMCETSTILQKLGKKIDPCIFWAVMNSIYSDYGTTLNKIAAVTPDIYGELAIDWLCDEDAVDNKVMMYYEYIVDHD